MRAGLTVGLSLLALTRTAAAQESEWASKGEVAVESRVFAGDDDARTVDRGLGAFSRLELRYARAIFEAKARGMGRLDRFDSQRTVALPEEIWMQVRWRRIRLRAGYDIINWTATESVHPADIINARNLDSDLENPEKIGEPMVALQLRPLEGLSIEVLAMPYTTAPILPSPASHMSFTPVGLDLRDHQLRLDRTGHLARSRFAPQGAIQVRQVLGPADITLHLVQHVDRNQPWLLVDPATLQPSLRFQTVTQLGGTAQYAVGALLAKVEWSVRRFTGAAADAGLPGLLPNRNHGSVAGGLEWNWPHDNGSEATLVLEGQSILGVDKTMRRLLTAFQRDALIGLRFAANDSASREVFVGGLMDLERWNEFLITASYQQRLGETWTIKAGLRIFEAPAPAQGTFATGVAALRKSDQLRLTLTRHC
jgi:hypothetical protein